METRRDIAIAAAAGIVLLAMVAAMIWPGTFWGLNFHAYLPPWSVLALVTLAMGMGYGMAAWNKADQTTKSSAQKSSLNWAIPIAAALGMGLMSYLLPIRTQLYGDTMAILKTLGKGGVFEQQYHLSGAFSPDIFTSKNGEQFSYSLAVGLCKSFGWEIGQSFQIITSLFGAAFAFIWTRAVMQRISGNANRILAAITGLTAGATQVFYSHPEVYAAPVFLFTAYLLTLWKITERTQTVQSNATAENEKIPHQRPQRGRSIIENGNGIPNNTPTPAGSNSPHRWPLLLALLALLLLAIRSHSAGFALIPSFLYALLVTWAGDNPALQKWLHWKRGGAIILTLSLAIGIAGYIIIFRSGHDSIATSSKAGNMFLTPLGDATQDNAYYILSPWHLWDYFQILLLGSAPAWILLVSQMFSPAQHRTTRKHTEPISTPESTSTTLHPPPSSLNPRKTSFIFHLSSFILKVAVRLPSFIPRTAFPPTQALSLTALPLLSLYLTVDPLLTMPRDWDLFILTAPPILVLALLAIQKMRALPWWAYSMILAIAFLQAAFIPVNHDRIRVHERQLDIATYIFRSGDVGGAFQVRHSIDGLPLSPQQRIARLEAELQRLQPLQARHNKADFAYLHQYGGSTSFAIKDFATALRHYEAQNKLVPHDLLTLEDLAVTAYYAQQFPQALSYSREAADHGSQKSSMWVLGFITAQALNQPRIALQIGEEYLQKFGDPDHIAPQIQALK